MAFFISQLIRYARAYSSYEWFILCALWLSNKSLGEGYGKERLKSSPNFYGRYVDLITQYEAPLSQMSHAILEYDHMQNFKLSIDQSEASIEHLQRVLLANRRRYISGHLVLTHFCTWMCSYVETNLSVILSCFLTFEFRTSKMYNNPTFQLTSILNSDDFDALKGIRISGSLPLYVTTCALGYPWSGPPAVKLTKSLTLKNEFSKDEYVVLKSD